MGKRWEPRSVQISFHENPNEERVLERISDILYSYCCQLDRDQNPAETASAVPSTKRRTRAHG
jgi:hypothetical protein